MLKNKKWRNTPKNTSIEKISQYLWRRNNPTIFQDDYFVRSTEKDCGDYVTNTYLDEGVFNLEVEEKPAIMRRHTL